MTTEKSGFVFTSRGLWQAVARYGLFVARLNNGDWMVGKASKIYRLKITDDHYRDLELTISHSLSHAVLIECQKQGFETG